MHVTKRQKNVRKEEIEKIGEVEEMEVERPKEKFQMLKNDTTRANTTQGSGKGGGRCGARKKLMPLNAALQEQKEKK